MKISKIILTYFQVNIYNRLASQPFVALTSNGWSSQVQHLHYYTYHAHYLTETFKLQQVNLKTGKILIMKDF